MKDKILKKIVTCFIAILFALMLIFLTRDLKFGAHLIRIHYSYGYSSEYTEGFPVAFLGNCGPLLTKEEIKINELKNEEYFKTIKLVAPDAHLIPPYVTSQFYCRLPISRTGFILNLSFYFGLFLILVRVLARVKSSKNRI